MRPIDYMLWMDDAETVFLDSLDFHAEAFITAAAITDETQKLAIRYLVDAYKKSGVWYKCYAIYPLVGGTAAAHKFNLKEASDTDEAFRLTFSGTITHNSSGLKPNGTNGYADTKLIVSEVMQEGNSNISLYCNENVQINGASIGAQTNATNEFSIWLRRVTTNALRFVSEEHPGTTDFTNTDSRGFYQMNRVAATRNDYKGYKDGVNVFSASGGGATGTLPALPIYIGGRNNNGTAGTFSSQRLGFVSIGRGLTDTELAAQNNINTAFQKILGRYL